MQHVMPIVCGITATIESEGGASQVCPDLPGHRLQGIKPCDHRIMFVLWTGVTGAGATTEP
jgi:hypothetical protein